MTHRRLTSSRSRTGLPAFTLLEIMVTIIIIAMLTGLALLAASKTMRTARRSADQQILVAIKNAITNFKNEFGFLPPLVHDNNPSLYTDAADPNPPGPWPGLFGGVSGPVANRPDYQNRPQPVTLGGSSDAARLAADNLYLQGFSTATNVMADDYRFSNYSITYYLMGMLDASAANGGKPIDGVDGPAMTAPRPDGSFTQRNKSYEASFNPQGGKRLVRNSNYEITFNDRWGRPIRYYRWEPRPAQAGAAPGTPQSRVRTLVPRAVGDPATNAKIRGARYALVITGDDRYTDMRAPIEVGAVGAPNPPLSETVKDDIVEVEE